MLFMLVHRFHTGMIAQFFEKINRYFFLVKNVSSHHCTNRSDRQIAQKIKLFKPITLHFQVLRLLREHAAPRSMPAGLLIFWLSLFLTFILMKCPISAVFRHFLVIGDKQHNMGCVVWTRTDGFMSRFGLVLCRPDAHTRENNPP